MLMVKMGTNVLTRWAELTVRRQNVVAEAVEYRGQAVRKVIPRLGRQAVLRRHRSRQHLHPAREQRVILRALIQRSLQPHPEHRDLVA